MKTRRNLFNVVVEKKSDIFPYSVFKQKPRDYPPWGQHQMLAIGWANRDQTRGFVRE